MIFLPQPGGEQFDQNQKLQQGGLFPGI